MLCRLLLVNLSFVCRFEYFPAKRGIPHFFPCSRETLEHLNQLQENVSSEIQTDYGDDSVACVVTELQRFYEVCEDE